MTTENEIMRELHVIRERIYEETKYMTPEEKTDHLKKELDEALPKLGMTLKRPHIEPLASALR